MPRTKLRAPPARKRNVQDYCIRQRTGLPVRLKAPPHDDESERRAPRESDRPRKLKYIVSALS